MPNKTANNKKFKKYVLDASAIYNGILSQNLKGFKYIPLCVFDEIEGDLRGEAILAKIAGNKSVIQISPEKESIITIKETAEETGDIVELSSCDISVLATAYELHKQKNKIQLITDDYDIQNLADYLQIPYRGIYWKGISSIYQYYWKCTGCGIISKKVSDECIECGSKMLKKVSKNKRK